MDGNENEQTVRTRPKKAIENFTHALADPTSLRAEKPFKLQVIRSGVEAREEQTVILNLTFGVAAGWIALHIAEGLLQRLGSYIFDAIFPFFKEDEQNEMIRKTADAFREIVREALTQESLRQAGARLTALQNTMRAYNNQQRYTTDRLTDATSQAELLVPEIRSLGVPAFQVFWIAGGLQLAVIQARYWNPLLRDEGDKTSALDYITDFSDHIDDVNTELTQRLSDRFGGGQPNIRVSMGDAPSDPSTWTWGYVLDGVEHGGFGSREAAQQASDERYEAELNRIREEFTNPSLMVKAKWQRLAQQVPNWDKIVHETITYDPSR
jgi:hypothetical protein